MMVTFAMLGEPFLPPHSRPRSRIFWLFWVLALVLAAAEWILPMSWWLQGLLTLLALGTFPLWAQRVWASLRQMQAEARCALEVGAWMWRGLLVLFLVFLVAEGAKLWLLKELAEGQPVRSVHAGYRSFVLVALGSNGLALSLRPRFLQRLLLAVADHAARLIALTFAGTILAGAFLLMLPVSVRNVSEISAIDAVFTSASAVCVTGLVVNQVARTYTFFGQVVLLSLIQIGGLGIMVLYGAVVSLAGRSMSTRSARMMSEVMDVVSLAGIRRLLWGIILFTVSVEALGAIALYYSLLPIQDAGFGTDADSPRAGAGSLLWAAVFHSVSAYCNAGFSLFRDGIVAFADDWLISGILMILVVAGGLGFPVWFELLGRGWARIKRKRPERLSLHSRVALFVSAVLIALGTVLYLSIEWSRSMRGLPVHAKVLTALFQSVVARTAGFNSLDFSQMAAATWLGTCVLMFIGASPGSTGGGIKTTTFAVLIAATWADLRGRSRIELWRRSLTENATRRAVGVTLISGATVVLATFLLLLTENFDALRLGFEAVSALATVGLSTGITPELSPAGKVILTFAMYLGRIGPLTLALALAADTKSRAIALPQERVGIG